MIDAEERERREAYARVRASFALEDLQLTRDEELDLESYLRDGVSLEELTACAVARWHVAR